MIAHGQKSARQVHEMRDVFLQTIACGNWPADVVVLCCLGRGGVASHDRERVVVNMVVNINKSSHNVHFYRVGVAGETT